VRERVRLEAVQDLFVVLDRALGLPKEVVAR
jgi:hypothetical protein